MHSLFQSQSVAQPASSTLPELFDGKTALQIQNEAYIRFETIMRIRYLRHSFDAYDAWGLLFLIYLGNLALDSLSNDSSDATAKLTTTDVIRSTAVLCINGLIAQSQSVYAGTLLSFSMIERLEPVEKALLSRHISTVVAQIDHPFDSEVTPPLCHQQPSLSNELLQWPLPNIKVEHDEEASMNHILKDMRELSVIQQPLKQGSVPSS